jgi:hypothetical protein
MVATGTSDFVTYQCTCGFRLERVPRTVVAELSRCLGCGRALRSSASLRTRGLGSVRDLR